MARARTAPAAPPAPAVSDLQSLLRGAGLRSTAPRIAVLRALDGESRPVTHGELSERLSAEGWDRATVYRNLVDLSDAGLVRRSDMGDHVWRFERVRTSDQGDERGAHPHFVCDACGDVTCLPENAVTIAKGPGIPKALRTRTHEIQLKGRCDRCA